MSLCNTFYHPLSTGSTQEDKIIPTGRRSAVGNVLATDASLTADPGVASLNNF